MMVLVIDLLIVGFFSLAASNFSDAKDDVNSFLWRVETDPPAYILGTMHADYNKVWRFVPDNAKAAFKHASHTYFELLDFEELQELKKCKLLQNGQTLSQVFPEDDYNRLKDYMDYMKEMYEEQGILEEFERYFGNWERTIPAYVVQEMIPMIASRFHEPANDTDDSEDQVVEESKYGNPSAYFLDFFLLLEAMEMDKGIGHLETGMDQCSAMNDISLDSILDVLYKTLGSLWLRGGKSNPLPHQEFKRMLDNYRRGNYRYKTGSGMREWAFNADKFDAEFIKNVVQGRSKKMGAKIDEVLKKKSPGDSYIFIVGAAHCDGKDSIPSVLESLGYKVTHLGRDKVLNFPRREEL